MGIKFANNASTNITHALAADATSVSVTPGTGDLFPSIVEGKDYFYATLAGNNGLEIVKVTKRVLDTMTIERAQDGTYALLFNQGDLFELRIVAADFEDTFSHVETTLEDTVDALNTSVDNKMSSYLPLSGGTMAGPIVQDSSDFIRASTDNRWTAIQGGFGWAGGGSVIAYGKDSTSAGAVSLSAFDGTTRKNFRVTSTECTYGERSVLTSAGGKIEGGNIQFWSNQGINCDISSGRINIFGGRSLGDGCAVLPYGKDHATLPGWLQIRCQDNDKFTDFLLSPKGQATWGGNNIITSAGGEVTGTLIAKNCEFRIKKSSYTRGSIPTNDVYQRIAFVDNNSKELGLLDHTIISNTGAGRVRLLAYAYDGSALLFQLIQNPNNGRRYATVDGNEVLTSAGGTITGVLTLRPYGDGAVNAPVDDKYLVFFGGTASRKGGYVQIFGKDNPDYPGAVQICADDGNLSHITRFSPDGRIATRIGEVLVLVASWSDGKGNWYRKYGDGWIEQGGRIAGTTTSGTVNFPIAFTNTNYTITIGQYMDSSTDTDGVASSTLISNYTTTSFRYSTTNQRDDNWYACGF